VENDLLEVDKIGSVEKENFVSSLNIATNEDVDKDETFNETNFVSFVGQMFLSEEEAYVFYKRYAYQQRFSIQKKVDS